MADQKETILFDLQIKEDKASVDAMTTSIGSLTEANKKLRAERKNLNLETAEGQKRVQEINKQLDDNNKKIKDNSSALEKQRLNIGNYGGALDKLVPGLGATIQGFQGMTKSALTFIATPIGAVIAALGLAISALTAYFKGSEEGQTKFNRIMNVGSAIVGKFSDLVQFLGGVLFENLAKGFEKIIGFLDRFVPGFQEATEALSKYLNLDVSEHISQLEEERVALNRLLITERGRLRNEIETAKLRAESTKDSKERGKALADVERLTNELFDKESRLAQLERDIAQEKAKLANNTIEDNDAIAESIAKVYDIERQKAAALKENATKQLAISEQQRLATEKERDAIVALKDAALEKEVQDAITFATNEERHQRELEQINERIQAYQSESEVLQNRINQLDLESDLADEATDANKDYEKEIRKITLAKQQEKINTDFATQAVAQSGQIALAVAGQSKSLSTGIALISTYFAAQKAFESQFLPIPTPSSPIRGAIAAGLAVAAGLARVAQINKVGFAFGGFTGDGYGLPDSTGFRPAGVVHEGEWVAPKWMVNKYSDTFQALESQRAKKYATGGFVDFDARQALQGVKTQQQSPQVTPVLVLEQFEYKQLQKNSILQQASVQ